MTDSPSTRRRFQFTLRRMLIFTAVTGLLLAVMSREGARYHQSITAAKWINNLGGSVSWNPELAENIIRDQTLSRITDVHFTNPKIDDDEWQTLSKLPHRFGLQIDGRTFTDRTIRQLTGVERLTYLVLNNTLVTEIAIIEFQRQRPDVTVMIGYPGDSHFREYSSTER